MQVRICATSPHSCVSLFFTLLSDPDGCLFSLWFPLTHMRWREEEEEKVKVCALKNHLKTLSRGLLGRIVLLEFSFPTKLTSCILIRKFVRKQHPILKYSGGLGAISPIVHCEGSLQLALFWDNNGTRTLLLSQKYTPINLAIVQGDSYQFKRQSICAYHLRTYYVFEVKCKQMNTTTYFQYYARQKCKVGKTILSCSNYELLHNVAGSVLIRAVNPMSEHMSYLIIHSLVFSMTIAHTTPRL